MARVLAPRCDTPPPKPGPGSAAWRLPASLLDEQVRRIALCAAVGAALWTYGVVMDTVARPLTLGTEVQLRNAVIQVASILISVVMLIYARFSKQAPHIKTDVALVYFVLNAAAVALINSWRHVAGVEAAGLLSWNAAAILLAGMIIPASPRRMFAAGFVAASTDPLAVWVSHLQGAQVPSVVDTLVIFMPNYACAAVAVLPSRVLRRIGQTLRQAQEMGSYQLEELLGRGGMGEVWRASHRMLKRNAAIKLVRPELMGAATEEEAHDMIQRFRHEAQATAELSSPHTIRLYDFGLTEDRTFYYAMELLSGRDLDSLVREFGPVPAERVLYLLPQIAHSLAEAHARGLVHRDITPANIYVCRMGLDYDFVKVLDFGLVSFDRNRSVKRSIMTAAHTTNGTPAFMAPEVILENAVDARADIYALGCVLYYLLTGTLVFEADTPMKMFVRHLQEVPLPPAARSELPIPAELDALVLECLEKDPAQRPQDIETLLRRVERIVANTTWTNARARAWWDRHLVDLATPVVSPASATTLVKVA
jgi:serine/threonine-protein kinase